MSVKISSFNCRGIQDRFKRKKIFTFLHQRKDDIIMLQETHSSKDNELIWATEWGGSIFFNSCTSQGREVAILFKTSVKC